MLSQLRNENDQLNYYQTIFAKAGDAIFVHEIGSVEFMDVNEAAKLCLMAFHYSFKNPDNPFASG
ncbi:MULTISPECIES: hypothetical protein [unclassified Acinetobacter]|uniref:hypothetical protein n=1 Tax=unclassified Acinetobacter TaxID=196816 RepID=UPI001C225A09|nr:MULTISPECIES: hypothetical protein [unclassified Acinetobacter]